ncbi:MAG: hypothetical protein E6R03_18140 [Hyphomicrobiaceae bacterium]|nr:MAG: hypothetical protein E6R03_18140 [Hyphomicrobiaceae bacterium]
MDTPGPVEQESKEEDKPYKVSLILWSGEIYRLIGMIDQEIHAYDRKREKYFKKFGKNFEPAPGKTDVNVIVPQRLARLRATLEKALYANR